VSISLSVVGFGMITAVGNSGPATAAAMRAGIRGVTKGKLWDPTAGDYMGVGRPNMRQWWQGRDMLAELVAPAIEECTSSAEQMLGLRKETLPILLIVSPLDRPLRWPDLDRELMRDVAHKLGRQLPQGSVLVPEGRSGIVRALEHAAALLATREHDVCVIAGVESFIRQRTVEHYMRDNRLLTAANSNGFSPGEAGAAVLVMSSTSNYRGPELAILGVGRTHDPSGAGGTETHAAKGDGLTQAIRDALAAAGVQHRDIDVRISDANGEHWKFKEIAFAAARLDRPRPAGTPPRRFGMLEHWHATEFVGEVGAAIGPISLGWAFHAAQRRYLPGSRVLLNMSEDNGDRAAIVAESRANRGRNGG
jgi:3-oxoacyl-[acyl-carrier-protein] synthase-1